MMSYLFRYGIDLGVKIWSIFYFPKGMERKEGCVTQKSAAVVLFVLFVMGQKMVLNGQSLDEAFIRNIVMFLVTMGMMLAFYNGQTGYRVFLGSVIFFSWTGWLKLFTPFVFSALHLPTFGYGINEVFPECYPSVAEGICRILVLVIMKRFAFHISGDREIGWGEIFFSLLPALIDHMTILILYYLMIVAPSLQSVQIAREVTMLILMLVFGMPCMLVATEQLSYVGGLNQEKGRFLTTKKDRGFHGIGLSNIKRIVDSYKGVCQIETKDQVFMLKWMVPFPEDELP